MNPDRNPTKAEKIASQHSGQTYRPDIDGLRAIAVLIVVGFHAFPGRITGGFIGVDIFFVLSGYLISSILFKSLENGTFSFVDFYSRRIRRIFPALLTIFVAVLAFGWFALLPDEYRQLGKHVAGGAGFISNFILWKESGYFDISADFKILLHLWSLGIEEQFYFAWPLLLWLAWKKRFNLLTLTIFVAVISFGLNLAKYKVDPVADFYSPQTRLWELLAGAALAHIMLYSSKVKWIDLFKKKLNFFLPRTLYASVEYKDKTEKDTIHHTLHNLLSFFGILLIAFATFKLTKEHRFPGKWALLPVFGAVCLIAAGPRAWFNRYILSNRILVLVGLISYPLYLWHWPLLAYARIVEGETPSRTIRIALVLLSVLLAWLTYRFIERPLRFGKQITTVKTIWLLALMAIMGGTGGYVYWKNGLPERPSMKQFSKAERFETALKEEVKWPELTLKSSCPKYASGLFSEPDTMQDRLICWYIDVGSRETVALLGDSHVLNSFFGIAKRNRELGINTVGFRHNQGLALVGIGKHFSTTVEKDAERLLKFLVEKQDIKTVFIFARRYESSAVFTINQITKDSLKSALQYTVSSLRRAGKKVFIVEENPTLPYDPRKIRSRPFKPLPKFPDLLKEKAVEMNKGHLDMLNSINDAIIIHVTDAFCPKDKCLMFNEDGLPLYMDDNHLTVAGSIFQVEHVLEPYLKNPVQ